MAMHFDEINNILRFDVPNSEAAICAQHIGIVDRTVGAYYMSDKYEFCEDFFNKFTGEYYIDIILCLENASVILRKLKEKNFSHVFKELLMPQESQIEALKWLSTNSCNFYKINPPSVNDKQKYLKLDSNDQVVEGIRCLLLGDLMSLYFKKVGVNGYILYIDKSPKFDSLMENNELLKWGK